MVDLSEKTEGEYTLSAVAERILETVKAAPQWDLSNDLLLTPDLAAALITSEAARKLAEERLAKAGGALATIADPKRLASYGDPVVLREYARAILKEIDNG